MIIAGLLAVFGAVTGGALALFFSSKETAKARQQIAALQAHLSAKMEQLNAAAAAHERELERQKEGFEAQKEALKADFEAQKNSLKADHAQALAALKADFIERSKLDDKKNEALLNQSKITLNATMQGLLEPLQKSITDYQTQLKVNETELKTSIKHMLSTTQTSAQTAEKLALILKGDKKIRGNFAEIQLKTVLQTSGLKTPEQYRLQEHFTEGDRRYIPDAVVYIDGDKSIIIDSKFSLPSSYDFGEVDDAVRADIAKNLRARIDELATKPYKNFELNTADYLLLFVPYDNILDLAVAADPLIYQYAYQKSIYLVTPNTLFMGLSTIQICWRNIKINENAQKVFTEVGKLHDKFALAIDDFERVKNAISTLQKATSELENKLILGRGNLAKRFDDLRELGAKTQKRLKVEEKEDDEAAIL